jgi:hypothetical protein
MKNSLNFVSTCLKVVDTRPTKYVWNSVAPTDPDGIDQTPLP